MMPIPTSQPDPGISFPQLEFSSLKGFFGILYPSAIISLPI
jgi:hypothetical protein